MPLLSLDSSSDVTVSWRIQAPRTRIWECLTEPHLLGQWLGRLAEGAVGAGTAFVVDHGGDHLCRSTVVEYAEQRRVAFTWRFPDEPESVVVIDLDESVDACEVRLTHRDLGDLGASYSDGWCVHLTYLEAAALGTPLPPSMFWHLHATMSLLNRR